MPDDTPALTSDARYDLLRIHQNMIMDRVRVEAFDRALRAAIRPGDTVLDVGAGTGILSLLAARAGAARVFAVEPTPTVRYIEPLARRNGLADRINVIHAGLEQAMLPDKADVLVFEWIGSFGVDEGMLPLFLLARDRWLKPGGWIVPERVAVWMGPAIETELDHVRDFWHDRPYGFDLSPLWEAQVDEWHYNACVKSEHLLAEPLRMWNYDSYRATRDEACALQRVRHRFTVTRSGPLNALAVWFEADIGGGAALSNAPGAPPTHWPHGSFLVDPPQSVNPGDVIEVAFDFQADGTGAARSGLSVRVNDGSWERHNDHRTEPPHDI